MASLSYTAAMEAATDPSTKTQFFEDERNDVPSVHEEHRAMLREWLERSNTPVKNHAIYRKVISNWTAFLSATSRIPSPALAPNRKMIQFGSGEETEAEMKKRYMFDQRVRLSVQGAMWRLFDKKEALLERWPAQARIAMNKVTDGESAAPLSSLMGDFGKQRRYNSVWTSLICFLLYSNENGGSPEDMGLELSEDMEDSLLDIQQAITFDGYPPLHGEADSGNTEEAVYAFILESMMDMDATTRSNPILWWASVLVQASLSSQTDYIARGHFAMNILPMDLDIEGRLDGMVHFAKVLLLDHAIMFWGPSHPQLLNEVEQSLNSVDNTWIGKRGSQKPNDGRDDRPCDSAAWKSVIACVEKMFGGAFGPNARSPMKDIVELRRNLTNVQ